MSDKTKAAPHGRQCSTTKQIQHTRTCAGGQNLSRGQNCPLCTLGTAALAQLGCTALQHTTQKSRSCEHYPVSRNQPYMIGGGLPVSSGVAKMQLGQLPYNFRHWQGYAAVPYTLKEISPNHGRLIFTTSLKQRGYAALQYTSENSRRYPDIGYHSLSASLVFLRWRRLISPCIAVLINCPVLSPGFFTDSMPSMISCAIRAVTDCDFAFFEPVAMSTFSKIECKTLYTKNYYLEALTCKTLAGYCVSYTLFELRCVNSEARQCANTNRASDHNVIGANNMAELQHTQTRPKYQYRFLALSAIGCNVIHIIATTEREARKQSPAGCVMVFAGRLPVREVRHA